MRSKPTQDTNPPLSPVSSTNQQTKQNCKKSIVISMMQEGKKNISKKRQIKHKILPVLSSRFSLITSCIKDSLDDLKLVKHELLVGLSADHTSRGFVANKFHERLLEQIL